MRSSSLPLSLVSLTSVVPLVALALVTTVASTGCPTDAPLTLGLDAPQHAPYFPIDPLAKHALNAASPDGVPINCDSCHGGRETFKEPLCFSCHQLDAVPLSTAHASVAGYEPIDARCLECHPGSVIGTIEGGATHSELWFPIDPDDAHGGPAYIARSRGGDGCAACHASVEDRTIPLCVDCHSRNDAVSLTLAHSSLSASYVEDDVACKECHADIPILPAVRPVSTHDDEIFLTTHHDARCTNCHFTYRQEPQPWALNFAAASCVQCHIDACTPESQAACFP